MMNKLLALTALFIICSCNSGKNKKQEQEDITVEEQYASFNKLANELNQLTETYASIYPFQQDNVLLKDYALTYKDFPTDTEEHNYSESFSANKDSINVFSLQEFYQGKIRKKLVELTTHKDFGKADIKKLVHIFSTKSADNKIYNFVYDENTGGTYRSSISYVYNADIRGEQPQDLYDSDGYDTIIPLKSEGAQRYLLMGEVVGCGTCVVQYAKVVHYDHSKAIVDFEYTLDTRMGYENSLDYNAADNTLVTDYFTDDLQRYCKCAEEDERGHENDSYADTPPIRHCGCTFVFNGETFVLKNRLDEEAKQ